MPNLKFQQNIEIRPYKMVPLFQYCINVGDKMKRNSGKYEKLGKQEHFIPEKLPPRNPNLELDAETLELYGTVKKGLGQLNEIAKNIPNAKRFIKSYIIKEALLSSKIENIHTTILEVFTHTANQPKPNKETSLVINYVNALEESIKLVKNLPISSRLILSAHQMLMESGGASNPGNYRKQNVKVGDLTPAPANKIPELMSELEKYINENQELPDLIKIGLTHPQFEIIHPFLDGNGRVGRMLIVLMMVENKLLETSILYPSYYFKKNPNEYYFRLNRIRTHGDFEGWIKFFLEAINESCINAYNKIKAISNLEKETKSKIDNSNLSSVAKELSTLGIEFFFEIPVMSITDLGDKINKSYNTANTVIQNLIKLQILTPLTKEKRNRLFYFKQYLELLEE